MNILGSSINIVLVDDDPDEATFFKMSLKRCPELTDNPYSFCYYEDPLSFLEDVENKTAEVDVLFLDIKMPQVDGYEVLRRVRTNPNIAQIPVIMYSSSANTPLIDRANELGASGAVTKTGELRELAEAVCAQIRTHIH
jgi:CheY-like chemotaxis protein